MPRKDFTQIAFDVVQQATGAVVKPEESAKTKAGRKGVQTGHGPDILCSKIFRQRILLPCRYWAYSDSPERAGFRSPSKMLRKCRYSSHTE